VNGLGDYSIGRITRMEDPVPVDIKSDGKKRRHLKDKEKTLYAPFSNIGQVNFDKSSGYITIPDKYVVYTKLEEEEEGMQPENQHEGQKMVRDL